MKSASLGIVLSLIMAISSIASDAAPQGEAKAKTGRFLVRANDRRLDVPFQARVRGLFSSEPGQNAWKQVGEPDLVEGAVSADGRFVAAGRSAGAGAARVGVWIYGLDQEAPPHRVFDRPYYSCCWANDGKVLFVSAPAGQAKFETFRVNVDGSGQTKLPLPEPDVVLDCTPDGSWLISWDQSVLKDHRALIHLTRPDGTEHHPIVDEPDGIVRHCRFSPDGTKLVYSLSTGVDPPKAKTTIWIVDRDGRTRVQVPFELEPGISARPFWSPDGSRLAVDLVKFRSRGSDRIVLVDRDGKNRETLRQTPWEISLLDWR